LKFSKGYNYFGYHKTEDGGLVWREWAPNATSLYLRGDFSKKPTLFLLGVLHDFQFYLILSIKLPS